MIPYVDNGSTLTIFVNGTPNTINSTHVHWRKIKRALPEGTEQEIANLLDVKDVLAKGVYFMYEEPNGNLECIFSSSKKSYGFVVDTLDNLKNPNNTQSVVPSDDARHIGTYATYDEVLYDYVERFI